MATSTGNAVARLTLREQLFEQLRGQIITGAFRPGQHLVETKLSNDFGVSRGPLREAIRLLEQEGLIVSDGKGHMLVRELSSQDITDLFEVRGGLESTALEKLTQRTDRIAVAGRLRDALEPLRDANLDFATAIDVDLAFHELICQMSDNPVLSAMWRQLVAPIRMMIIAAGPERASSRMRWQEHVALADVILYGDPVKSRAVMLAHMSSFCAQYASEVTTDGDLTNSA